MPQKILLADDSITIQKVISLTLASEDYELTVVGDGNSAIERAKTLKPDLIMADVAMPGKNGYEVCEAVKNDPQLKGTPVLLLSGTFETIDPAEAERVHADSHIVKPFESEELINRVKDLLSRERPAGEELPEAEEAPRTEPPSGGEKPPVPEEIWMESDFLGAGAAEEKGAGAAEPELSGTDIRDDEFDFSMEPASGAGKKETWFDLELGEEEFGARTDMEDISGGRGKYGGREKPGTIPWKPIEEPIAETPLKTIEEPAVIIEEMEPITLEEPLTLDEPLEAIEEVVQAPGEKPEEKWPELETPEGFLPEEEFPLTSISFQPPEISLQPNDISFQPAEISFQPATSFQSNEEPVPPAKKPSAAAPPLMELETTEESPMQRMPLKEKPVKDRVEVMVEETLDKEAPALGTFPRDKVREIITKVAREVIEEIAWEVVPELAEEIIRKEFIERVIAAMARPKE